MELIFIDHILKNCLFLTNDSGIVNKLKEFDTKDKIVIFYNSDKNLDHNIIDCLESGLSDMIFFGERLSWYKYLTYCPKPTPLSILDNMYGNNINCIDCFDPIRGSLQLVPIHLINLNGDIIQEMFIIYVAKTIIQRKRSEIHIIGVETVLNDTLYEILREFYKLRSGIIRDLTLQFDNGSFSLSYVLNCYPEKIKVIKNIGD